MSSLVISASQKKKIESNSVYLLGFCIQSFYIVLATSDIILDMENCLDDLILMRIHAKLYFVIDFSRNTCFYITPHSFALRPSYKCNYASY